MPNRRLARSTQTVVSFDLQDADGLEDLLTRRFAPVAIEPEHSTALLSVSGTFGAVAGIDFSRNRISGNFRLVPRQNYDGVFFFLPTAGKLVFHQDDQSFSSSCTTAIAADGLACRAMEFQSEQEFCGIVMNRPLIAERLSVLLGRPIVEKPSFQTSLDMTSSGAVALRALLNCVTSPDFGPQLNCTRLTAERVRETIIDLVLETWPNSYSEMLGRPAAMIAPKHVKLAIDFINTHAELLPSGTELAALSGSSLRSLQAGFRRFAGTSIAAYQRQVRLERGVSI